MPKDNDIFVIDESKSNETITLEKWYGVHGVEITDEKAKAAAFAKQVAISKDDRQYNTYWIKASKTGSFFNPYGMYDENQSKRKISGNNEWNFRQVGKKTYEFYLQFLQSKNRAWLINAERENL